MREIYPFLSLSCITLIKTLKYFINNNYIKYMWHIVLKIGALNIWRINPNSHPPYHLN